MFVPPVLFLVNMDAAITVAQSKVKKLSQLSKKFAHSAVISVPHPMAACKAASVPSMALIY